ncbi:unnamed protein product, partial [Closterium sp. Naga37s-1]
MSSNRRHAHRSLANGSSSPTRATIPPAFPRDASPSSRGGSGGRKPTKNRLESNAGHHASAYASNPNSAGPARQQQQQQQGEASALIGTVSTGVKRGDSSLTVSAASRKAGVEKGDSDSAQIRTPGSSGGSTRGVSSSNSSSGSSSSSSSGGSSGSSGCSKGAEMGTGGVREVGVEAMFFVHMCVFLAFQLLCLHRSALHDINYHVALLVCLLLLRRIVACFIDFHPPAANKASPPRSANSSSASSSFLSRLFLLSSRRNESVLAPAVSTSGAGNAMSSAAARVGDSVAATAARSAKEAASSGTKEWRVKGKAGPGGDKGSAGADGGAAAAATAAARDPFPLTGSGMVAGDGVIKAGNYNHTDNCGERAGSTIGAGRAGGGAVRGGVVLLALKLSLSAPSLLLPHRLCSSSPCCFPIPSVCCASQVGLYVAAWFCSRSSSPSPPPLCCFLIASVPPLPAAFPSPLCSVHHRWGCTWRRGSARAQALPLRPLFAASSSPLFLLSLLLSHPLCVLCVTGGAVRGGVVLLALKLSLSAPSLLLPHRLCSSSPCCFPIPSLFCASQVGLYVAAVALLALKLSLTLPWQSQLLLFVPPICYAIIVALLNHQIRSLHRDAPSSAPPSSLPSLRPATLLPASVTSDKSTSPPAAVPPAAGSAAACAAAAATAPLSVLQSSTVAASLSSQSLQQPLLLPQSQPTSSLPPPVSSLPQPPSHLSSVNSHPHSAPPSSIPHTSTSTHDCPVPQRNPLSSITHGAGTTLQQPINLHPDLTNSNQPMSVHLTSQQTKMPTGEPPGEAAGGTGGSDGSKAGAMNGSSTITSTSTSSSDASTGIVSTSTSSNSTTTSLTTSSSASRGGSMRSSGSGNGAGAGGSVSASPSDFTRFTRKLRRWPKLLMRLVLVEACMGSYLVGVVPIQGTYMHEDILVSRLSCCLLLGYAFVGAAMLLFMKEAVLRREQVEYVAAHLGCWHRVDVPNFTISRDVAEWNPHSVPYSEGAIVQRGGRLFVGLGRFNTAQPGSHSAALLF